MKLFDLKIKKKINQSTMSENNMKEGLSGGPNLVADLDKPDVLGKLVKVLRAAQTLIEKVWLPLFRPQVDDVRKRLEHVEKIEEEFMWSDLRTLVTVGGFLLYNAKRWFDNWSPVIRNWENFRKDFLEAFPSKRKLRKLLNNVTNFNSDSVNTYETYVHEKVGYLNICELHSQKKI